jgi:hypothetical protein
MKYDEAEAYRHASHGCTTPEGEPCIYCEREAEPDESVAAQAAQYEAEIQADYERWSATLALTAPIPSVFLPGGEK